MIVVLCESFRKAQDTFYEFVDALRDSGEWVIKEVWPSEYCVETDDDLRYIFIDEMYGHLFNPYKTDFVGADELFYTLYLNDMGENEL